MAERLPRPPPEGGGVPAGQRGHSDTATLKDNITGATTTVLPRTCTSGAGWKTATGALTAGHAYTLTLSNVDDDYPGDPTFTYFDDVTVS